MDEKSQKTRYGMDSNVVHVMQAQGTSSGLGPPGQEQLGMQWMPMQRTILGCPPGLEYLTQLDQLLVHQQVDILEAFTGWEVKNKYQIKNTLGQQVYFAGEESTVCMRLCCGSDRAFVMHIVDNTHQEVIRMVRPYQWGAGCCWCADCSDYDAFIISVESPPGNVIGQVRQRCSKWKEHYDILDANSRPVLKVRGPCCPCQAICCTEDVDFRIMTYDDREQIGKISKQWEGWVQESCTKADNFAIQFPLDMDVKVKATLLGALFLIEYVVYEKQKEGN